MCKAFSCIIGQDQKVTWKLGVDSHSELARVADTPTAYWGSLPKLK